MDLLELGIMWARIVGEDDSAKIWEFVYEIRKWLDNRPLLTTYFLKGHKSITEKQFIDLQEHYPKIFYYQ